MLALCLDSGTLMTGYVFFDSKLGIMQTLPKGKSSNEIVREFVRAKNYDVLVMENITPQGRIGYTTIDTIRWLGKYEQVATDIGTPYVYFSRPFIKKHLTGKVNKTKDSHIRQAVIDKIYPQYTRKDPGPLKGVTADAWSAVAIGIVWSETFSREIINNG